MSLRSSSKATVLSCLDVCKCAHSHSIPIPTPLPPSYRQSPSPRPFPKLPQRLLEDFSPSGALFHLAKLAVLHTEADVMERREEFLAFIKEYRETLLQVGEGGGGGAKFTYNRKIAYDGCYLCKFFLLYEENGPTAPNYRLRPPHPLTIYPHYTLPHGSILFIISSIPYTIIEHDNRTVYIQISSPIPPPKSVRPPPPPPGLGLPPVWRADHTEHPGATVDGHSHCGGVGG